MVGGKVVYFEKQKLEFGAFGGDSNLGKAYLARLVDGSFSSTMGAGILKLDGCSIPWTLLYDEVCVVLQGTFVLELEGETIKAGPGDTVWIPKKTPVVYSGEGAQVFYALYPADWRQREGNA